MLDYRIEHMEGMRNSSYTNRFIWQFSALLCSYPCSYIHYNGCKESFFFLFSSNCLALLFARIPQYVSKSTLWHRFTSLLLELTILSHRQSSFSNSLRRSCWQSLRSARPIWLLHEQLPFIVLDICLCCWNVLPRCAN